MRSYGRGLRGHGRKSGDDPHDHERIRKQYQRELTISNLEHLCRYFPDDTAGRKSWKLAVEAQLYQLAYQGIEIPLSVSTRVNNLLELCNDRTPAKRANDPAHRN